MFRLTGFFLLLLLAGCQGPTPPAATPAPEPEPAPAVEAAPQPFENEVISVPVSPLLDMSGDAWEHGN